MSRLTIFFLGVLFAVPAQSAIAEDGEWTQLFNGKDLTGWKPSPGDKGNWHVIDGVLVGSGLGSSYLFTKRDDFRDFHIRTEAKINDGGNSGLFFRTEYPKQQNSYEAQINSTHRDPLKTGSLYKGNKRLVRVKEMLVKPNEWFTLEVIVKENHIVIKVDGNTTVDYEDTDNPYRLGHFSLQQHDSETVASFRKIEVKELAAPQAPQVATQDNSKPKPKILHNRTWTWEGAKENYAKYSRLTFEVGMGNSRGGFGIGDAGVEIDNARYVRVSVDEPPAPVQLDDNSFAGFVVDYHMADGYTKRVALSIGAYPDRRRAKNPVWGKASTPDQFLDLGIKKDFSLDLKKWAPNGWDGRVWFTVSLQNTGPGTSLKGRIELLDEEKIAAERSKKKATEKAEQERREAALAKAEQEKTKELDRLEREYEFDKITYTQGPNGEALQQRATTEKPPVAPGFAGGEHLEDVCRALVEGTQTLDATETGYMKDEKFVKHGSTVFWYAKPSKGNPGKKLMEEWYVAGQRHGVVRGWYRSGRLWFVIACVDDRFQGKKTEWYEDGKKSFEGQFLDGLQHGKRLVWYPNGTKAIEEEYKNGKRDGAHLYWFDDGKQAGVGSYKDGLLNGTYTQYAPVFGGGMQLGVVTWKMGKKDGRATHYYPGGQKWIEQNWSDGVLDGLSLVYNPDGSIKEITRYKDGFPQD